MNKAHRTITSVAHDEIKNIVRLHNSKGRKEQKKFIVEGIRTLETFLDAGWVPCDLYVSEPQVAALKKILQKTKIEQRITVVADHVMQKISSTSTPSGILGTFSIPAEPSADNLGAGLVCANISDPGNMGTLIRTCAAMNKKTVVVIESVDPWNPKVIQASAGTIAQVNLFSMDWHQLVQLTKNKNLSLCALVVSGGKQATDLDLSNSLLVVGSEAHGIPTLWIDDCDQQLTLAMPGKTESLNAAVAGSIALYIAVNKEGLK